MALAVAAGLTACDDTGPTSPSMEPTPQASQAAISAADNHNTITVRRSTGLAFNPNENWINDPYVYFGNRDTYFADVNNDRRADAIMVDHHGVWVRLSTGSRFDWRDRWISGAYFGTRGTFFADVTGDGAADAIVVNDGGVTVRRSTGDSFAPSQTWISGAYYGSRGIFFADVTGDGRADAIAVNDYGVTVRRALYHPVVGAGWFDKNETWIGGAYYGTRGTFFADVTGDGRADAIAVNNWGVTVRRAKLVQTSVGWLPVDGFGSNETWTSGAYYGNRGTFFADVTGDGRADAIVVTDYGVTVRSANHLCQYTPLPTSGACFRPNQAWTQGPYYGDYRPGPSVYFADVTGGGSADAIVINEPIGEIEQP
jgi:hypothetical protein